MKYSTTRKCVDIRRSYCCKKTRRTCINKNSKDNRIVNAGPFKRILTLHRHKDYVSAVKEKSSYNIDKKHFSREIGISGSTRITVAFFLTTYKRNSAASSLLRAKLVLSKR